MRRVTKGFTLVELLIAVAIIGILAAVLTPQFLNARKTAIDRAAEAYAHNVYTTVQAYIAVEGSFTEPNTSGNLFLNQPWRPMFVGAGQLSSSTTLALNQAAQLQQATDNLGNAETGNQSTGLRINSGKDVAVIEPIDDFHDCSTGWSYGGFTASIQNANFKITSCAIFPEGEGVHVSYEGGNNTFVQIGNLTATSRLQQANEINTIPRPQNGEGTRIEDTDFQTED